MFPGQGLRRFTIDANDLLSLPVAKPSQDARFRWGQVAAQPDHISRGNTLLLEITEQRLARLVVTHDAHRNNLSAKLRQVNGGVSSTARRYLLFALFQNQDRGLAGDP